MSEKESEFEVKISGEWDQIQCMNALAQVMERFKIAPHNGMDPKEEVLSMPLLSQLPYPAVNGIVKWFEETYYRR